MGKRHEVTFHGRGYMDDKMRKKICSTTLKIREMQNKTSWRYHCTLIKSAK